MTEKLDLKADEQAGYKTISLGVHPQYGLETYMRFSGVLNIDVRIKQIIVRCEKWMIAADGKVYEELYSGSWQYIVTDNKDSGNLEFTQWNNQLGQPIIVPAINKKISGFRPDDESGIVTS